MLNLSWNSFSVFVIIFLFGIGGFTLMVQSKPQEPEVIFVGNPSELPTALQSKLPTSYKWVPDESHLPNEELRIAQKRALESGEIFITPDSDFPYLYVSLAGNTDMPRIMNQAREKGKKAIYVFDLKPDPSIPVVPLTIDIEQVWSKSMEQLYDWADGIDNLLTPQAFADAYSDSSCTSGSTVFSGTCLSANWPDDFPSDGKTPGAMYCFHYTSQRCHWFSYGFHVYKNIAGAGVTHGPVPHLTVHHPEHVSFVKSMKGHHGDTWIKRPFDLTVNIYLTGTEVGNAPGSCGGFVCGCGQVGSLANNPRISDSKVIWIPSEEPGCEAFFSSLETARHEVAHTYGYSHTNMDNNFDDVGHCINAGRDSITQNLAFPPLHTIF